MNRKNQKQRKQLTVQNGIRLLLLLGMVLRIWYAVVTPVTLRGYDILELSPDGDGKAAYLLRLVQKGELPQSYRMQSYQQPFYYLLSALVSKGMSLIWGNTTPEFLVNGGKVVSCVASCLFLLLAEWLMREYAEEKVRIYGIAVLSVTPALVMAGGRLGEDALVGFFMLAVMWGTLQWETTPDWKHTLLLALLYGCGMMTKISLAFPACYTAYIFWKNRKVLQFWQKMIVFSGISLPIGMWYSARNFLLFGQPIGYVWLLGKFGYQGETSYVARFFSLNIQNLLETPYAHSGENYNFPLYLLKSELFGHFQYETPLWLSFMLLAVNTVLTLIVAAYGIYRVIFLVRKGEYRGGKLRPFSFGLLFGGYAAVSYLKFPYSCSMDFRYYLILAVCKALALGCLLQEQPRGCCGQMAESQGDEGFGRNWTESRGSVGFSQELRILQGGLKVLCVLFVILSLVFLVGMLL